LAQAVRLSSATSSHRAALAIVNPGRPAKARVSCGSLARALKPDAPAGTRNLSAAHEVLIVDAIMEFQKNGFNITKAHLIEAVADIIKDLPAEKQVKWRDGRPSEHWVRLFCRRHSMRLRRENMLESVRARAMTMENFAAHFSIMAHLMEEHNITPDRLSNWMRRAFHLGGSTPPARRGYRTPRWGSPSRTAST